MPSHLDMSLPPRGMLAAFWILAMSGSYLGAFGQDLITDAVPIATTLSTPIEIDTQNGTEGGLNQKRKYVSVSIKAEMYLINKGMT